MFSVAIETARGLRLQSPPFDEFIAVLTHRSDYGATQALGAALREAGIETIEYRSARDPEAGINVALFMPAALGSRQSTILDEWLCTTNDGTVTYYSRTGGGIREFARASFLVDGILPLPAA
jgi:hypothetical protein